MATNPDFDIASAHKYFSVACFNAAWDLIDKPQRTAAEDEEMILLSLSSLWHWTQRADRSHANLSVGYWQVARVYALLGQTENARRYGGFCLEVSRGDDVAPFYLGYAYEALARAESVAGNGEARDRYLDQARQLADSLPDPEERQLLVADLATIRSQKRASSPTVSRTA